MEPVERIERSSPDYKTGIIPLYDTGVSCMHFSMAVLAKDNTLLNLFQDFVPAIRIVDHVRYVMFFIVVVMVKI